MRECVWVCQCLPESVEVDAASEALTSLVSTEADYGGLGLARGQRGTSLWSLAGGQAAGGSQRVGRDG